ncbi:MAG: TetR/AcrR family transcriptional regulator [Leucobacter sp.]|nr:TetR/AcrR family transcriptional regulator [Leucobacter sp.]
MTAQPVNEPSVLKLVPDARRRDAAKNRETLLRAAQEALAEHPNASLDSIAQAAGLSRRALYGHFPDRDSLLREIVEVSAKRYREIADGAVHDDPRIALVYLAEGLWHAASTVRASVNISMNELYREDAAHALEPLRQRLSSLTRAGIDAGVFRADMSPDVLALLIEEAAKATLRDRRITAVDTADTAVKVVLSIAGLSWVEQAKLLGTETEAVGSVPPPR